MFDSSENRITRGTYVKTGFGVIAYPVVSEEIKDDVVITQ